MTVASTGSGRGSTCDTTSALDYYLVRAAVGDPGPAARSEAIVVEEFVLTGEHTAAGLDTAWWEPATDTWDSSAALSRRLRADPALRARVTPIDRAGAEIAHRRLGGAGLPDEPTLRARFRDRVPLAVAAPLRLGPAQVPPGFLDRRIYRILFADGPATDDLTRLTDRLGMTPAGRAGSATTQVLGTAERRLGGDLFRWELRRIGPGLAWSLDLTACLGGSADQALGALLRELRVAAREHGLIPVTIERLG